MIKGLFLVAGTKLRELLGFLAAILGVPRVRERRAEGELAEWMNVLNAKAFPPNSQWGQYRGGQSSKRYFSALFVQIGNRDYPLVRRVASGVRTKCMVRELPTKRLLSVRLTLEASRGVTDGMTCHLGTSRTYPVFFC